MDGLCPNTTHNEEIVFCTMLKKGLVVSKSLLAFCILTVETNFIAL